MNVRTITVSLPFAGADALDEHEARARRLLDELRVELAGREIALRTTRLTMSPIGEDGERRINPQRVMGVVRAVTAAAERLDVRWTNVPIDLTSAEHSGSLDVLGDLGFEVVRRHPRSFVCFIAASGGTVSPQAVRRAAAVIKSVAGLEASGYHNFRVGVALNVPPHTPFFPFSYGGAELGFSLGLEMPHELARLAQEHRGAPLPVLRAAFLETLSAQVRVLDDLAARAGAAAGIAYHGLDLSIAPYPEPGSSVAGLIEQLGVEQFGGHGTLFVTAFLTDLLREVARATGVRTAGFNGVMFSLLEDEVMGQRNNAGTFSVDSLLLYSTVCGCGIDMVPLPGDVFPEELAALILDVAAASAALGKPLGVRVLPIPARQENEFTAFHMDFLFNTRIKKMRNVGLVGGKLADPFAFLTQRQPWR